MYIFAFEKKDQIYRNLSMINHYRHRSVHDQIESRLHQFKVFQEVKVTREFYLLLFFVFLFLILISRLFYLQIIQHSEYDNLLNQQHISDSTLKAKRWDIYANEKSNNPVKLTDNITSYNVFVDPKFVRDKKKFIDIISPSIYKHLCEINGMTKTTPLECIENIEKFTETNLLPTIPEVFYYGHKDIGSGMFADVVSTGYYNFDLTGYNTQVQEVISWFNSWTAYGLIKTKLDQRIYVGIKKKNYLGFFYTTAFLDELTKLNLSYVSIENINYVYIDPNAINNITKDSLPLRKLLDRYGYLSNFKNLDKVFSPQENRYVKIISDANPIIAQEIKELKLNYYQERSNDRIPLLHGLGLEPNTRRYYEYGWFLSNILWFVDKNNNAFYGIEQYFNDMLRGKDGKIIWRSSSWIGNVGANEFQLEEAEDGNDIYLTIDIGMQKEIETIIKGYYENLRADSISVLVYDPFEGKIKASANYPSFNPNDYNEIFEKKPLWIDQKEILDDITYIDIPIYIKTGGEYKVATTIQRNDINIPKYVAKNINGPQVFVDKNISMPYEPGSIFKAFTVGIALDIDEIRFYDYYNDPGKVKIGQFTIKNVAKECEWDHTFLNAFVYSCNVGMVRIAQKINQETFYNYIDKLGFWKLTNIELAWESEGFIEWMSTVSVARFYNNTFGQGLLATPLQIAAAYGPLVNGWYYVQPTIVQWIFDKQTNTYHPNQKKIIRQIFRPETAEALKIWLFDVIEQNPEVTKVAQIKWFTVGGKSWTSQISYKGKYQQGNGRTNASFVGLLTQKNPKYIVIVQVRRPRKTIRWFETAGKIFKDVATFLINYSLIEK